MSKNRYLFTFAIITDYISTFRVILHKVEEVVSKHCLNLAEFGVRGPQKVLHLFLGDAEPNIKTAAWLSVSKDYMENA